VSDFQPLLRRGKAGLALTVARPRCADLVGAWIVSVLSVIGPAVPLARPLRQRCSPGLSRPALQGLRPAGGTASII
jgi:hypothetical protein